MTTFSQATARLEDAVFGRLGEDADWEGIVGTVRVRRREADELVRADYSELIGAGFTIKVRKSQVAAPVDSQVIQILDKDGDPIADARFKVDGEPMLDRRGVWACPVKPVS